MVRIAAGSSGANEAVDGGAVALHARASLGGLRVPAARVGRRVGAPTPTPSTSRWPLAAPSVLHLGIGSITGPWAYPRSLPPFSETDRYPFRDVITTHPDWPSNSPMQGIH